MQELKRYPRTQHIRGSRFQHGDHDLEAVPWEELAGKWLVVEEKVDGAQVGISFDTDGEMLLQSRGHYLRGGPREKQFELFKQWAACHRSYLQNVLGTRLIAYGEWLYAKHTAFYDALPHYFMEFDVYDREDDIFLDTEVRARIFGGSNVAHRDGFPYPIVPVRVLFSGHVASLGQLAGMIAQSAFIDTVQRGEHLKLAAMEAGVDVNEAFSHTDMHPEMEGLYVKWEEDGEVKGRYKFVRESFTNAIAEQEEHWHDRPIIQNRLAPGAWERMFEQ